MDARGQLGCDLWSAEGSCKFQTSFRPMYSQGSNFQHIVKHPSHQNSALCRRSVSTNQDRSFCFTYIFPKVLPIIENEYISGFFSLIYVQKYCLIEDGYISDFFPLIYFQKYCLVDRCLNVLVISQIQGLTGPSNGCLKPV